MTEGAKQRMLQTDVQQLIATELQDAARHRAEMKPIELDNKKLEDAQENAKVKHEYAKQLLQQKLAARETQLRASLRQMQVQKERAMERAEDHIKSLAKELESKNSKLQWIEADTLSCEEQIEKELREIESSKPCIEETAEQQRQENFEKAAIQHQANRWTLEERSKEELLACKQHLHRTEESAEQKRLQDLKEARSSLQHAHEHEAREWAERCSLALDDARECEQRRVEEASAELKAAADKYMACEQSAEHQRLEDLAMAGLEFGSRLQKFEDQSQDELKASDKDHRKNCEMSALNHENNVADLRRQLETKAEELQVAQAKIEATLSELKFIAETEEEQHLRDQVEAGEEVNAEAKATTQALNELKVLRAKMVEEQRQRDLGLFEQRLEKERQSEQAIGEKLEVKHQRMVAMVKEECSEELERLEVGLQELKVPKLVKPLQSNPNVSQQRFLKAYQPLCERLNRLCTSKGPLPGVRARVWAPVRSNAVRPSQELCLQLLRDLSQVLASHGIDVKDVSVLWNNREGCEMYQPAVGHWDKIALEKSCSDDEQRVGCEVRVYSHLSINTLVDELKKTMEVEDGTVRQTLIRIGAGNDGPFDVECVWPRLRIEAEVRNTYPQYKITGQQSMRLTAAISAHAEKCQQALLQSMLLGSKDERAVAALQALCKYESLVQIEGKLMPGEKVYLSKDEKSRQEATDLDGLLSDAMRAQSKLKRTLAPLTAWARANFNNASEVLPDDGQRFFVSTDDCLIPKAEIYDPGIQNEASVSNSAAKLQIEYESDPPLQSITDISQLKIVFEDAAHLLEGLERLMDRFNVLWVRNGFRQPFGTDQCTISIGIKQQLPQVHISEVHLYLRHMVQIEQRMGPEHSSTVEGVLKSCNVLPEDMEGVLHIVKSTMYSTDGLLIHHAVNELERLQAALEPVGIRSKEYRALEKEVRKYANSLIQARVGSAAADSENK